MSSSASGAERRGTAHVRSHKHKRSNFGWSPKKTPTPLTYSLGRPRLGLNLLRSDTKPLACEYVNFFLTFLHHRNSPCARDSARSEQSHQILQSLNSVRARACLCMCHHHSFHSRDRAPNFSFSARKFYIQNLRL